MFSKNFGFVDQESCDSYKQEKNSFRDAYRYTDTYMDFNEVNTTQH